MITIDSTMSESTIMPSLYYRIETPGLNVLKTVTDQAVMGLLDELDLVEVFKDSIYIINNFTANSQYADGNGRPSIRKDRCDVNVTHVLDKTQVPWPVDTPYTTTALGVRSDKKGSHTPILIDTDSNIFIEHYTVACALEMSFELTFQSFDVATKAFDTIKAQYQNGLIRRPFDLSFSYPVSMSLLKYLQAVTSAKTDYANKTVLDYINDKKVTEFSFDIRTSQLIKEDADKELKIRVEQLHCLAELTMDQKEPEVFHVDQLPDGYKINLDFKLQFGRPNIIAVHTPLSVDNTLLPDYFFLNSAMEHHYNPSVTGVYQDILVGEIMRRSYGDYTNAAQIIRIPVYDDWLTFDRQYDFFNYRPILTQHFTLDGPVTTIDLKEMGDIAFHPVVLEILKESHAEATNYGGIFHLGVYANDLRLGNELVSLSEDLILTIRSDRPDKSYHLMISETLDITKTDVKWDQLLVKYRYFFPVTIERNLNHLVNKRYFYIDYDNQVLSLISRLTMSSRLKTVLKSMIDTHEVDNEIFGYTQSPSQLADYMSLTHSYLEDYSLPVITPESSDADRLIVEYYSKHASLYGRSLLTVFLEKCLVMGYITLDTIPRQYIRPDQTIYPYQYTAGGYYGINTPVRVLQFDIRA